MAQPFMEPRGSIYLRHTLFSIVILSSLVGNSVVIKAFRQHPHLQKPFTYFVVTNLAVAELVGTVCLPFFQVYDELKSWPFGDSMCRLVNAFMLSSYFVIPWSLAAIAFLRCKAFVNGQMLNISGRFITAFLVLLWFLGTLVCSPTYIFAVQVKSTYDNHSYWCIELFPGDTLATFPSSRLTKYYFVRFILNFGLPGVIIVLSYGGVAKKLQKHLTLHKDLLPMTMTQTTSVIDSESPVSPAQSPQGKEPSRIIAETCTSAVQENQPAQTSLEQIREMERDLLKMIYIVILIYLVCYIPYQLLFLMEYFSIGAWKWRYYFIIRKYAYLMTCFPSALHPICYGTMSKFYAQAFSTFMLCRKKKKRYSPSNLPKCS